MLNKKDYLFSFIGKSITQMTRFVEDIDKPVKYFYKFFGTSLWHYYKYGYPLLKMMKRNGKEVECSMISAIANIGVLKLELI